MQIPKSVIEKAIEGGWEVFIAPKTGVVFYDKDFMFEADSMATVLDRTFWQALGKALNWGRHINWCRWESSNCEYKATHFFCPHSEHECNCNSSITWQFRAESFFHQQMAGMSTDAFWESLLANK